MIIEPQDAPSDPIQCDVCVIGSGAGGAAAAWELSRSGLEVVCLEAGGNFTEKDFSQDFGVAARQLYAEDGHRIMSGGLFIPVAGGVCIGGSTVINSGICFRAPEWRFESWREKANLDFSYQDFLPYVETTEKTIGVSPSNPAVFGGNNRFCMEGLTKLGWSGGPMPRNAPGCVGCGACNTGCPTGAKLSVARTFIPASEEHGAVYYTWARAEQFLMDGDRVTGVVATLLDPATGEPDSSLEVRARAVVLSAGAIQTPALLQKAGLGNEHVGRHLHVHPATGVIALTNQKLESWRGIPQGFYSDEFFKDEGIILESYWASPEVFYMAFPFGRDSTDRMLSLGKMAALGGTITDQGEGTVTALGKPGRVKVKYELADSDKRALVLVQLKACELMLAAGALELYTMVRGVPTLRSMDEVSRWLDPETIRPKQLMSIYSSHPQGTARMGADPEGSVVDCRGQVHGHPGLHVMDASIFPDVLGVNPQVTIMSLSLLLSARLAEQLA